MSVIKKLARVGCERCRQAGHYCQAQMVLDEIALCLRCADDEPCIYVTAQPRVQEGSRDLCDIPRPTREDREAVRSMNRLRSSHGLVVHGLDPKVRAQIIKLSLTKRFSGPKLAHRCGVSKTTIYNVMRDYRRMLHERTYTPIIKRIGSELVSIAPMAVFGAEMLEARYDEAVAGPKKKI